MYRLRKFWPVLAWLAIAAYASQAIVATAHVHSVSHQHGAFDRLLPLEHALSACLHEDHGHQGQAADVGDDGHDEDCPEHTPHDGQDCQICAAWIIAAGLRLPHIASLPAPPSAARHDVPPAGPILRLRRVASAFEARGPPHFPAI